MIREYEFYHGAVFLRLLNSLTGEICIANYLSEDRASYVLKGSHSSAGLYIKHCSSRLSPWKFTFLERHQNEIHKMKQELGEVFLALVCDEDGIVVLNYSELKQILDENHEPVEWVSAARSKRQMYTVKGKDGALNFKVGEAEFPRKILSYISSQSEVVSSEEQESVDNILPFRKAQNNFRLHSLAKRIRVIFR